MLLGSLSGGAGAGAGACVSTGVVGDSEAPSQIFSESCAITT